MGGHWFTMDTFLGLEVPLEKVKILLKTLKKENKSIFKVYLCESESHTRNEWERAEEKLCRCMGFLGMVRESFTPCEITSRLKEFEDFMQEKEEIFKALEIPVTCGAKISSGIKHSVRDYIDDLPDDEDLDTSENYRDVVVDA
jgi:hypothetical protein